MSRLLRCNILTLPWVFISVALSANGQASEAPKSNNLSLSSELNCRQDESALVVIGKLIYLPIEGGVWLIKTADNRYQLGQTFTHDTAQMIMAQACRQPGRVTTGMVGQPLRLLSWRLFDTTPSHQTTQPTM